MWHYYYHTITTQLSIVAPGLRFHTTFTAGAMAAQTTRALVLTAPVSRPHAHPPTAVSLVAYCYRLVVGGVVVGNVGGGAHFLVSRRLEHEQ